MSRPMLNSAVGVAHLEPIGSRHLIHEGVHHHEEDHYKHKVNSDLEQPAKVAYPAQSVMPDKLISTRDWTFPSQGEWSNKPLDK